MSGSWFSGARPRPAWPVGWPVGGAGFRLRSDGQLAAPRSAFPPGPDPGRPSDRCPLWARGPRWGAAKPWQLLGQRPRVQRGGPASPRRPGPLLGQQRLSSWRAQPGADAAVVGTWRGRSFLRGSAVPSAEGRAAGPRLGLAIAPRPRAPGTGGPEVILPELLLEATQPVAQLVIYLPFLTVTFSKQRDEHFHLK